MYSPKLPPDLVIRLYHLKQQQKRPMTHLVKEAVKEYLSKHEQSQKQEKEELQNGTYRATTSQELHRRTA